MSDVDDTPETPASEADESPADEEADEEFDLEAIQARARRHAEHFLREEFQDRRRQCILGTAAWILLAGFNGFILTPVFHLDDTTAIAATTAPLVAALLLWPMRFRCSRCEKIPIVWATIFHHRTLDLPGCPHCGLPFHEPEDAPKLYGVEQEEESD